MHPSVVYTGFVLLFVVDTCRTHNWADSCDIAIRADSEVGVHNIKASCSQGSIHWLYGYGGMRVTFVPSSTHRWRLCLRGSARSAVVVISLEENERLRKIAVLGGKRKLGNLHSHLREHCTESLPSSSSAPAIYIDVAQWRHQVAALPRVRIDYDLEELPALTALNYDRDTGDCRPCTENEIVTAVCSSEFVVTGSINDVRHNKLHAESAILVNVDKVLRQSKLLFEPANPPWSFMGRANVTLAPLLRLLVPLKCGVQKGAGKFLFTGRIRLERARLQCAPRWEEFEVIWTKAVRGGQNFCLLN